MRTKLTLEKNYRIVIQGLPLAGIIISAFFPISALDRQLLILILLIWFQVYFISEIFLNGK